MKYSYNDIKSTLTSEKKKADGTVTRFFYRPVSYPVAMILANAGLTPNAVTYISIGFCAAGFACMTLPLLALQIVGIACFMLFAILDCADGNIARAIRNRRLSSGEIIPAGPPYGEWVDALGGYCAYTAMLLGMGLSCMLFSGPDLPFMNITVPGGSAFWMVLASITCSANLLMRLAFQSWRTVTGDTGRSGVQGEKRLSEEIGITGYLVPLYLFGLLTDTLSLILIAYSVVYCGGCVLSTGKLILKLARINAGQKKAE